MSATNQIRSYTGEKVRQLLTSTNDSAVRASLARLRRGLGHTPGEFPELWGDYLLGMPEELYGHGTEISRAEWAVYIALTNFAFHQQGKDRKSEPMHCGGISLGMAAARLIHNEGEDRERIARRFYPVATASDMTELSQHLRGLISLLRSEGIALDYGRLAGDLFLFQDPDTADSVRLRWGEDFCRKSEKTSEEKG